MPPSPPHLCGHPLVFHPRAIVQYFFPLEPRRRRAVVAPPPPRGIPSVINISPPPSAVGGISAVVVIFGGRIPPLLGRVREQKRIGRFARVRPAPLLSRWRRRRRAFDEDEGPPPGRRRRRRRRRSRRHPLEGIAKKHRCPYHRAAAFDVPVDGSGEVGAYRRDLVARHAGLESLFSMGFSSVVGGKTNKERGK